MNFKNVTVAGSGVLGCQIAFQTAFHGFTVSVCALMTTNCKAKAKFFELSECYKRDISAPKNNSTIHLTISVLFKPCRRCKMQI